MTDEIKIFKSKRARKILVEPVSRVTLDVVRSFPFMHKEQSGDSYSLPLDHIIVGDFVKHCYGKCEVKVDSSCLELAVEPFQEDWVLDSRLRGYQGIGCKFLLSRKRALLADETGTGKGHMLLGAVDALGLKALYIAPKYVLGKLAKTAREFFGMQVAEVYGDTKRQREKAAEGIDDAEVVFTNYETISPKFKEIFERKWDIVIIDEAHYIQGRNSTRTKNIKELINGKHKSEYVWLATATPVWNKPDALWSLVNAMYPDRFSSYWRFVFDFCTTMQTHFGLEILESKSETMPTLQRILEDFMIRRKKRDVMKELPPRIESMLEISVSDQLIKENRHIKRLMREDGHVNLARLRVHLMDRDNFDFQGKERLYKGSIAPAKFEALKNILSSEEGRKILIFCKYTDSSEAICSWLGKLNVKNYNRTPINGGISIPDRQKIIAEFQDRDEPGVLVGTVGTMGTGIDLQDANVVVFMEHPHTFSELDQCIGRVERMGATESQMIYHVIQKGTLDEKAWASCLLKEAISDDVLIAD